MIKDKSKSLDEELAEAMIETQRAYDDVLVAATKVNEAVARYDKATATRWLVRLGELQDRFTLAKEKVVEIGHRKHVQKCPDCARGIAHAEGEKLPPLGNN